MTLLIVLIAVRLDMMIRYSLHKRCGSNSISWNETISIGENAGLMGVYIPPVITKAIDILKG